ADCKMKQMAQLSVTMTGSLPLVEAKINSRPAKFVISSGTAGNLISAAAAAEFKLNVRASARPFKVTAYGVSTDEQFTSINDFSVAGVPLSDLDFIVAGGQPPLSSAGELGQNVLGIGDVEYDLSHGNVRLMRIEDCGDAVLAYWVKAGQSYSLVDLQREYGLSTVSVATATLNDVNIRVMLSSGNWQSLVSPKAAERAGVKLDSPQVTPVSDVHLWSGIAKSYITRFSRFKIGDEEIRNVQVRIADFGMANIDMILGADFFLAHRIYVANSQQKIYFTYNGGPVFDLSRTPVVADRTPEEPEPSDAESLSRRGAAFAARRDFDHALADLDRACDLDPKNPEYFYQRGQIFSQRGLAARALDEYYRALELKPDHVLALLARADISISRNDLIAARADLDSIDRLSAKQADIRLALAHRYDHLGAFSLAIAQLDPWIEFHGVDLRSAEALNARCWSRASQNVDLGKALEDCDGALRLSSSQKFSVAAVLASRGLVRLRMGDYDRSIVDYSDSIKLNFKNAMALYGRGIDKMRLGHTEEGQADLTEALLQVPRIADEFAMRGIAP
ncbi:MAG TPA: aspartyl protease family protein, partial [Steroidobacteraceae bacterium]|nr:aspartyl protease family protein [Steroidobacteraceae bacterium]